MPQSLQVVLAGIGIILVAQFVWRRLRKLQQQAQRQLATLEFKELRPQLQEKFLAAASATGKPRGLRWKQCDLDTNEVFAIDRANGELHALVGATVSFEAIPGGGMEEVEAVGSLRSATATFVYRKDEWTTDGRVVFNHEPAETLAKYQESLELYEL